jgi:hypothetical protein
MKTEYIHPGLGISSIWQTKSGKFSWANRAGEGCDLASFEAAVQEATEALEACK